VFNTLRWRLVISHVLVLLIAVLLAGVAFFFLLGGYRERLSTATLREVAVPVSFQVERTQSLADLRLLLRFLRQQSDTTDVGAVLVDGDGRVITDVNPADQALLGEQFPVPPASELSSTVGQLYRGAYTTTDGRSLDFVVIPLPQTLRGPVGTRMVNPTTDAVVLFIPRESAGTLVWDELVPRLLLAASAGLAPALLLVALLSRWIYRPLTRLRGATQAVSSGDLASEVDEDGPRETRELARDFNRMTREIAAGRSASQDFLMDASHELRTPLTSVRGFSEALFDGTIESDAERVRAGEIIQRETDRLLRLVSDLSDLARLEAGQARLEPTPLDVADVIQDVRETFAPAAEGASLRLEAQVDPDLPPVLADRDRLTQVLDNLLDNAVKHAPQASGVGITARRDGPGFVEIAVADDGPGIASGDLDRVFERFYRGPRGNSGLGLAISRELVRAHGGTIRVESGAGSGARFVFTLPVAPLSQESAPQG
jgi:signal transduction histidine kinase